MASDDENIVDAPVTSDLPLRDEALEEIEILEVRAKAIAAASRKTDPPRASRFPSPEPLRRIDEPAQTPEDTRRQLDYYKNKAIQLDTLVFEMRALLQSGKGFSEILNVEPLLRVFMSVCRERCGVVNSTVLLLDDLDPEQTLYRVRAYHGVPDHFIDSEGFREEMMMFKLPHDNGLLWQLIHQGEVFSVRDIQKLPRFKTAFRSWHLETLRSDVWVPLIRGGQVLGILTLGEVYDGTQVPEGEFAFLEEIASVAATNIDSALKYEKNSRILNNLRTLYDINQQLANVNDFKRLTIETLATAVRALNAQKANLMLYNPETDRLEMAVVWGNIPRAIRDAINDGRMETKSFVIGEGVAGKAAKDRKPVRINDRSQVEQVGKNVVYSILAVPLLYGGDLMGVMTLTNKVKKTDDGRLELDLLGRFGEDDAQLLLGLADQAAVNLHKARLYSVSITDRLTGLFNARHFESSLEAMLEVTDRTGMPLSLAVIDIDHFKKFNDTYGHKAGDAVLAHTAGIVRDMVRPGTADSAFRYGGEEFCLLMPNTTDEDAGRIVNELRKRVEESSVDYEGKRVRVTISAGVASYPKDAPSRQSLFELADKALYSAKSGGRNGVVRVALGSFTKVI